MWNWTMGVRGLGLWLVLATAAMGQAGDGQTGDGQAGEGQAGAATGGGPQPALWRVTGAHGQAYLFGTVHVMRKGAAWETAQVKDALTRSGEVYFEIADLEAAKEGAAATVQSLGVDREHPLSTKLSAADEKKLDEEMKAMGVPAGAAAMEPLRPWVVAVTLSMMPMMKAGYDPAHGVDEELNAEARREGKTVRGFETAEGQMRMLAELPEADQVRFLHAALEQFDRPEEFDGLVTSYLAGDVEAIAKVENAELRDELPTLYERLLPKRNKAWAALLAQRLGEEHGGEAEVKLFVAVGAAHLAGEDSVQAELEKRGLRVERCPRVGLCAGEAGMGEARGR